MSRFLAAFCLAALGLAGTAEATISVSGRHLVILREGIDAVWGSYIFAVQSDEPGPAKLTARIRLPKETEDFMPQEGVEPNEVKLDGDALAIAKDFPPGTTIVTIGFKIPSSFGKGEITMKPAGGVEELTVLVPKRSNAKLDAAWLEPAPGDATPDPDYAAFVAREPLAADAEKKMVITGIPEGRKRIWILGGVVGALMVVLAAVAALRTRPRLSEGGGETVLVG